MKNPTFTEEQLRGFYNICESMENSGNGGWYRGSFNGDAGGLFITDRKFVNYRQGIVFFSTGWGWRLRKGWRETFGQRFYETVVNWTDARFVTIPKGKKQPTNKINSDMVITRLQAKQLAMAIPTDATEVDMSAVNMINASGMDELMRRLEGRTFVGMNQHVAETYQWVLDARGVMDARKHSEDEQ